MDDRSAEIEKQTMTVANATSIARCSKFAPDNGGRKTPNFIRRPILDRILIRGVPTRVVPNTGNEGKELKALQYNPKPIFGILSPGARSRWPGCQGFFQSSRTTFPENASMLHAVDRNGRRVAIDGLSAPVPYDPISK
jgi:hypothetical protein